MVPRPLLPLSMADLIVDTALFVAHKNGLKPMTDAGGHLVAFKREDGSSILRESIARGKAFGALGLGLDSGDIALVASSRPAFINAAIVASDGRVVPAAGGVLLLDAEERLVGAVGVSGDLSEKDEACAIAAARAAGLVCKALSEQRECILKGHTPEMVERYVSNWAGHRAKL